MKAPLCLAVRDSQEGSHGFWLLDVSSFSDPEVLWNTQLFFSFEKHVPGRLPIQTTGVLTLLTSCTAWVIICGIPIAKVQNHDNPPLILHHYIVLNIYVHIQTIIKMHLHPHTPIYTSTQTYISTYTRTHRTTGCTPPHIKFSVVHIEYPHLSASPTKWTQVPGQKHREVCPFQRLEGPKLLFPTCSLHVPYLPLQYVGSWNG